MHVYRRLLLAFGCLIVGTLGLLVMVAFARTTEASAPSASLPRAAATCVPYWSAVATQNVDTNDNVLAGVAVNYPTDVWAVGYYTDTGGVGQAMIQHYDGSTWSLVAIPHPGTGGNYLEAITARAANDMWAVGFYRATAGSVPQTLVLHSSGGAWTQMTSASPGAAENYLYGVAAVSDSDAWAVGYYANTAGLYRTLTLRWNGGGWNTVSSPSPTLGGAGLRGVVAVSASEVWAVGIQVDITLTYRMYALKWDGASWSTTTTPNTAGCILVAVAIATPGNLWAVGGCQNPSFQTAIIKWNGSAWSTVASPNPGTGDNLLGGVISSSTGAEAYAVGGYNDTGGPTQALTLYWNGSAWTPIPADNPGSTGNALLAISSSPTIADTLWAVGSQDSGGPSQTLAEQFGYLCETATPTPVEGTPSPTSTSIPTATNTSTPTAAASTSTPTAASTTATATSTPISTATFTDTPTAEPTSSSTPMPTATQVTGTTPTSTPPISTNTPTNTPAQPTATATATIAATATPTACTLQFADVLPDNTFYAFVECLACKGIINGYACGGPGEPCNGSNDPYFRPGNNVTRGQIAKIVSNAAGFNDTVTGQTFEDVAPGSTFYDFVERLVSRDIMSGYACGGFGEPCIGPNNRPYFRPNSNATRGQLAKIVSNAANFNDTVTGQTFEDVAPGSTFYNFIERLVSRGVMSGYACGGPGEPCVSPNNRPYFRPGNLVTRGQTSKIVGNTFFPSCEPAQLNPQ